MFRYFDHLLLCNVKVTIHCICGELNFLSAHVIAGVYFGPAAFDSTESFELFLHAVSELLRRFLDVPDL